MPSINDILANDRPLAPDGMTILAENVEFIGLCKANSVRQVARGR